MAITSIASEHSTSGLHGKAVRPSLLRRAFDAVIVARQLKADREIAELLIRHAATDLLVPATVRKANRQR